MLRTRHLPLYFLLFLAGFNRLPCLGTGIRINIILVIIGDNPVYGYSVVSPAFDVAFARALALFPDTFADNNISMHTVYEPGGYSCAEAEALMPILAAKVQDTIYRLGGFNILVSPGELSPL